MTFDRRTFLRYGVVGAGLLAVGGVGLGLRPTVMVVPRGPLRALDPTSYSVLAAVAEVVAPGRPATDGAPAFPSALDVDVPGKIDQLLTTLDPGTVAEIVQALHLLENALTGLLLDGRPTTFTACGLVERTAIFEGWRTSRLHVRRQVYKALRGLCASAYYASPEAWPGVGYPGPPDFSGFVPDGATP